MTLWQAVTIVFVGLVCLWLAWMALLDEEWDEWRKRRRRARVARSDCPCCRGYPVCWVSSTGGYHPSPETKLCPRHAIRWAHIRDLERELLS